MSMNSHVSSSSILKPHCAALIPQHSRSNETMGDTGVMHTDEIGAGLRVAQVVGLTSTAFLCGKNRTP